MNPESRRKRKRIPQRRRMSAEDRRQVSYETINELDEVGFFKLLQPELAPFVSTIDDEVKCAMSRLGDDLRVAGTIEVGGYDLSLDTPLAKARCKMLADRIEEVLPGVCDTRLAEQGGNPRFWTG